MFIMRNHRLSFSSGLLLLWSIPAMAAEHRFDASVRQKLTVLECSVSDQSQIWTAHLKQFLIDHPALTVEQRSVIYEGLGLLAGGVIERARSTDLETSERAYAELDELDERTKTVMPLVLGRAAFAELEAADTDALMPQLRYRSLAECECSLRSDWCLFGDCYYTLTCTPNDGCGTFFAHRCIGLCP